jgi:hypothetical protein
VRIEAFSKRVLRRELWSHQAEVAKSRKFISVVAAARRTGKTVVAETLAIHTAFSNRACRVIVLSATQDAARRLTESIGATLNRFDETRGAVVDDFATRVRLRNGSQIISLPASQRQVRGYGEGVLLVLLDEASFMPEELWRAAHYTALDERANGSRIVMLGTPFGGRDHFFRQAFLAGQDGDPDHSSHHWTYKVNKQLDHTYLERQRDRVSPAEFAAEIRGEWSDAAGQLFPDELIEAQTAPVEAPSLAELIGLEARPILGLDWGVSFDRSAAAIVYRLPGLERINPDLEERPRFLLVPHVWPVKTRLSAVVEEVHRLAAKARFVSTETSGVGSGPSQLLEETVKRLPDRGRRRVTWNFVATTAPLKTAGYGCLLGLAERGSLFWLRHPDFLRQLRGLRFEQGDRGFTRIEASDAATHDDACDAAMISALPYSPRGGGRIVCGLAQLADPARAVSDAELPEMVDDYVEAGSGVRIWRRPPLQGVLDTSLWVPPGMSERQPKAYESPQVKRARERVTDALQRQREEIQMGHDAPRPRRGET